jgi:ATP-binding cassette subfamily C protein
MTGAALVFLPILQPKISRLLVLDAENQGILVETFKGAMTVKTTAAQPQLWNELQSRFGHLATEGFSTAQIGILSGQFSGLVSGIGGICLLWFGSSLVIANELSIGQLLAFNAMNTNFVGFIGFLAGFTSQFVEVKASMLRFTEVLDAQEESAEDWLKPSVALSPEADVSFENVNFFVYYSHLNETKSSIGNG